MEEYNLSLWEIYKNCESKAYIGGEFFESESGATVYFDGEYLNIFKKIKVNEKLKYVRNL